MPARKSYGYNYYESGSAARKIDYTYDEKKARRKNVNKKAKAQPKSKAKASSVIMIVCVFTMALVLVYRYNIINEKNLKSQSLASDLTKAESALVTSQIDVEQNTDLNEIEAFKTVVNYNDEGLPESIAYDRMASLLVLALQEIKVSINSINQRLDALEA